MTTGMTYFLLTIFESINCSMFMLYLVTRRITLKSTFYNALVIFNFIYSTYSNIYRSF